MLETLGSGGFGRGFLRLTLLLQDVRLEILFESSPGNGGSRRCTRDREGRMNEESVTLYCRRRAKAIIIRGSFGAGTAAHGYRLVAWR